MFSDIQQLQGLLADAEHRYMKTDTRYLTGWTGGYGEVEPRHSDDATRRILEPGCQ